MPRFPRIYAATSWEALRHERGCKHRVIGEIASESTKSRLVGHPLGALAVVVGASLAVEVADLGNRGFGEIPLFWRKRVALSLWGREQFGEHLFSPIGEPLKLGKRSYHHSKLRHEPVAICSDEVDSIDLTFVDQCFEKRPRARRRCSIR